MSAFTILYRGRQRPRPLGASSSVSISSRMDSEENGRMRHEVGVSLTTMYTPRYLGLSLTFADCLACVLSRRATRHPGGIDQIGESRIRFLLRSSLRYLFFDPIISDIVDCAAIILRLKSSKLR